MRAPNAARAVASLRPPPPPPQRPSLEARSRGDGAELRCGCGSLLAKLVEGAVELKCRRCKEMWRIPLDAE